jgi:formate hydrogenlyase subunit 3/multisubunit Na+/H+ antiporter MnhD subunit
MIIGMPPSPLFSSKFLIATTMLRNGAYLQFTLLMLLLLIVSWGMLHVALKMHLGDAKPGKKLSLWLYLAPAGLLLIAAVLGIFVPVLD